jgi:two-component system CAI-1 autoinducer sensor kinase/phosphatase CqsS
MTTKSISNAQRVTWFFHIAHCFFNLIRNNSLPRYPLEPILQTSATRLKTIAIFMVIAQPVTFIIWALAVPQPFDNIWLRMALSLLPTVILIEKISKNPDSQLTELVCCLIFWIELPVFFFFMYLANGGNNEWLVSICCMVLIYYHIVDWRIATVGVTVGFVFAKVLQASFDLHLPQVSSPPMASHAMLVGFCWMAALALGASAANMRREHLKHIKNTMVVIANNLRTPLTIAQNISSTLLDAAIEEHKRLPSEFTAQVDRLASRLISTTKLTTNVLDTQIVNVGVQQAPPTKGDTLISALDLTNEVVGSYPFAMPMDRQCVRIVAHCDFTFLGSFPQFSQVLSNLISNSASAIRQVRREIHPGDLQIIIESVNAYTGQIRVIDHGNGIPGEIIKKVFDPLFTTKSGGLGLGLTYCKMVVEATGGTVSIESNPNTRQTIATVSVPISASVDIGFPYVSYGGAGML